MFQSFGNILEIFRISTKSIFPSSPSNLQLVHCSAFWIKSNCKIHTMNILNQATAIMQLRKHHVYFFPSQLRTWYRKERLIFRNIYWSPRLVFFKVLTYFIAHHISPQKSQHHRSTIYKLSSRILNESTFLSLHNNIVYTSPSSWYFFSFFSSRPSSSSSSSLSSALLPRT